MMATSSQKFSIVKPAPYNKLKPPKTNDFTQFDIGSQHDTRKRGTPKRQTPSRAKSMPLPRNNKERMRQTKLGSWATEEFGEAENGPGMTSGPLKPIGSAMEQGPWDKPKENRLGGAKDITLTEPFIGINRKPKATKLATHNRDLPGAHVESRSYLG
jgi:hypothetical protein